VFSSGAALAMIREEKERMSTQNSYGDGKAVSVKGFFVIQNPMEKGFLKKRAKHYKK
jgi:hypothetical protein